MIKKLGILFKQLFCAHDWIGYRWYPTEKRGATYCVKCDKEIRNDRC